MTQGKKVKQASLQKIIAGNLYRTSFTSSKNSHYQQYITSQNPHNLHTHNFCCVIFIFPPLNKGRAGWGFYAKIALWTLI